MTALAVERQLVSQLCTAIADPANEIADVCMCAPMPGTGYAQDFLDGNCGKRDGLGWVQLQTGFPSIKFPIQDQAPRNCEGEYAWRFRMGLLRSMPIPRNGRPLDQATFIAVTEQQMTEADFLLRTIICNYPDDVMVLGYQPEGPQGGAIGGYWEFLVTDL